MEVVRYLQQVLEFLEILAENVERLNKVLETLQEFLSNNYSTWPNTVTNLKEWSAAIIRKSAEEAAAFCCRHSWLIEKLVNIAGKATAREVATQVIVKTSARTAVKATSKGATTLLKYGNPVGIAADVAQDGLEYTGLKGAGKAIGVSGNITSGAMIGGAVGGPAVAAVGALAGFGVWGLGEVTGRVVDWAFGEAMEDRRR